MKLVFPPNDAVMVWLPAESVEVANVAVPFVSVPVPRVVAPSAKVTVPDGVPLPGAVAATVAVNVTVCPEIEGFGEEVSASVVLAWPTVTVAAVAEVRLPVARVAGDALELSASTAKPPWPTMAVVAEAAECAFVVNQGGLHKATTPVAGVPPIVSVARRHRRRIQPRHREGPCGLAAGKGRRQSLTTGRARGTIPMAP